MISCNRKTEAVKEIQIILRSPKLRKKLLGLSVASGEFFSRQTSLSNISLGFKAYQMPKPTEVCNAVTQNSKTLEVIMSGTVHCHHIAIRFWVQTTQLAWAFLCGVS